MAKSILQDKKECYICHGTYGLHLHHIFYGTGNRPISDREGFTCYLCAAHHNTSANSVHFCKEMDIALKAHCQAKYEEMHSREDFMRLIGRNYLE